MMYALLYVQAKSGVKRLLLEFRFDHGEVIWSQQEINSYEGNETLLENVRFTVQQHVFLCGEALVEI